jgi:hypothetical protein
MRHVPSIDRPWALAGALAVSVAVVLSAQTPAAPAAASTAKAKELVALLQARKLEAIAARDPAQAGRFVAALLIPNVQLLAVSSSYSRPLDIEYYLYQKDFMSAYVNLNSSTLVAEKVFIEDARHDGLVALPGKALGFDTFSEDAKRQVFDGDFADPKRKNQKKISQDDYLKVYSTADEKYTKILTLLIEEMKKS